MVALRLLLASLGAGGPHFVRATASLMIQSDQPYPAVAAVRHTLPVRGKSVPRDLRTAEVGTSDQRNHARGRDGRCGSPPYPSACPRKALSAPIRRSHQPLTV
jgi:hypothetical protein